MWNPTFPEFPAREYRKYAKYPGMSPKDTIVWNAFIDNNPDFCKEVYYNFRVGEGVTLNTEFEPNIVKMAKSISQLRIDAITVHANYIRIVELKPYGSCTALGQLIAYNFLLSKRYANLPHVIPTLMCFSCPHDIKTVLNEIRFDIIRVPVPSHVQL